MAVARGTYIVYTVRPGDSLYSIANRFAISLPYIIPMNSLYPPVANPDRILPGQVLLVLTPGMSEHSSVLYHVSPGDTLYNIAHRFSAHLDLLLGINSQIQDPNQIRVNQDLSVPAFVYSVERGDTLYGISQRFGISLTSLIQANQGRPMLSPDEIYPDFHLIVPLPSSRNMVVYEPLPNSKITSGTPFYGYARAFEATLHYQIRDEHNQIVTKERTIQANQGAPEYGIFSGQLELDHTPSDAGGSLWFYTRSARDGSIQDLIQINVQF